MEGKNTKSKHYTSIEKSLFLQILNKYKDIIECKRSNASTLRDKEVAWNNVSEEFNNSSLNTQERTVQQLKKLWTNLKQNQRDIITKGQQARFATGGGPEVPCIELDPEVALIAPTLMTTAPVLFSSNMNEDELEVGKEIVQNTSGDIENEFEKAMANKENNNYTEKSTVILCETNTSTSEDNKARKRKLIIETKETEEELKIKRIKSVMEQERYLAETRLKHEETIAAIRETHLKEINKLELRTALAKAELAELKLKKEKENI